MTAVDTMPRTLDWAPNHHPLSLNFPVAELTATRDVTRRRKHWDGGPVLNQHKEGACVGMAFAGDALGKPTPVDLARLRHHAPEDPNEFARYLYGMAKYLDDFKGEAYSGTSTLGGAKAAQNAGVLKEYRWAFGVQEVIDAVLTVGPVVIGINWYSGMYNAPGGVLRRGGNHVGGHALRVVGYEPTSTRLNGAETLILRNSWGEEWGIKGEAEITVGELGSLLSERGEACVPVRRSYGR